MPRQLDGTLAELIKRTRAERGISEHALAARAGVSRRQLCVIQQGANTTVLRVIGLAQALGLTEIDLGGGVIGRVDPPARVDVKAVLRHLDNMARQLRSARRALLKS